MRERSAQGRKHVMARWLATLERNRLAKSHLRPELQFCGRNAADFAPNAIAAAARSLSIHRDI